MGLENCRYDIQGFMDVNGFERGEALEIYQDLIHDMSDETDMLAAAASTKDLEQIARIVHIIKGVSGNYRLSDVHDRAGQIEHSLKSGNVPQALSSIPPFIEQLRGSGAEIMKFFA